MAKRKTWRSKLTKAELKHLKEQGCTSLALVKMTLKYQADTRKMGGMEPCWTCWGIAQKLDLPV